MKKSKINIFALALAGALVVGSLAGCGSKAAETPAESQKPAESGAPAAESSKPEESKTPAAAPAKDSIIIATENETPSLTVEGHNAVAGDYMNRLTHNGLMKTGMDLEPELDLAESIEADANDPLIWHVKLREGVKFHDGTEMKAEDVKASLDQARVAPQVAQYTKTVTEVTIVDDYNIDLHTATPSATLLSDLTHHGNYIYPKALIDSGNDFNANPIGTGPYKFKEWVFGDKLVFEAFDEYFNQDEKAAIKNMTWQVIPEGSSRSIALETGDADFVVEVATTDLPRLEANPDITVLMVPGTSHNFLMINNERAPFDNQLFRKALDSAIDKESVVMGALDGLADPVYTQVPMGFKGTSEENINSYDVEKAKQYLAESGIDPASVSFSVICSNDQKARCAEIIQANLLEIGIKMDIERMDLATYLDVTAKGDYDASIGRYTSSTLLAYLNGVFHSKSINASNKTRTNIPEVDALIDKASATIDEAERIGYLEEVTSLLNDNTPQIPVYQDTVKRAYNAKLGGVEVSASGTLFFNKVFWTE
ncbi:ABC transporter substrate-binding protein [Anaeropeptidivorans aminofermentans]|uniref:ABC transporter substrate-binding protein n=1 Tax=Anaeropeptidivorans aminofermentans TaxID=2934315 RepID=UPI00202546BE|nr:ABC transporter substrate-binding protein [Anaeropeptidivorans aminofermentans]